MNKKYSLKCQKLLMIFLISGLCGIAGCKQDEVNKPGNGGEKPGPVSNVQSKSLPGAASISYTLPPKDAMYVMAEYETSPGVLRSVKASKYNGDLLLEGFAKEGEYDVNVYAVGSGEQKSDPVKVKVSCLTPPVVAASKTLKVSGDFGGINVSFENVYEGDLSIEVLTTDSITGKLKTTYTQYTKAKSGSFSVRGFQPVERLFAVTMRDRWSNTTDTTFLTVTPFFEQLLDYRKYVPVFLPTDTYKGYKWTGVSERTMNYLFDGDNNPASLSVFMTESGGTLPQHFTFDIGKISKLSRYKIWMKNDHTFTGIAPLTWEIWGTAVQPNLDGSWDNWIKLGDYKMVKPSGSPLGKNTAEDLSANLAGLDFSIPPTAPAVRYLRFKTLSTWSNLTFVGMQEMWFYGAYQQ